MSRSTETAHAIAPGLPLRLDVVLGRVAGELATLAALGTDLQDALGTNAFAGDVPAASVRSMQNLDLMTQTLGALSRFMAVLAGDAAGTKTVDVAAALRTIDLSSVAARLAGETIRDEQHDDLELF